ncbi:hypothetical protein [Rubritalea tangerina]|uniref:DUF4124 domain-containing protein n=1 Tax=Rubritalea tangerina TaxID=430798 RepID=A0ABW4Z640_9BACT
MKVFYLLIIGLGLGASQAQEVQWYDAEGNVVKVTQMEKEEKEEHKAANELLVHEAYHWDARRIFRKSRIRGRAIYYNSPYVFGYGFGYGCWPNYYTRSYCTSGGYYRSYCRPSYRGSSLNIVIRR